ncbi:MAG: hypothetical protein RIT81_17780 [Deltaproteobacteria bacterium]
MTERPARWICDELPPSEARRGGDPAEHAFKHDLDTFVREVVQNANDQRVGDKAPEVHFAFHALEGDELTTFLDHLAWSTLEPHLKGAADARGGRSIRRSLEELTKTKRLLLLTIEDRNTVGLLGDESSDDSHFRALCKDTLYSHKQQDIAAGGSYGLGKSVLWSFSGLSTVLFNSVLQTHPRGKKSPRLIGRTELPSHVVGKKGYTGSGWFGVPARRAKGERAESLWSLTAALESRGLYLHRNENATGTTILIVGFRDPTLDEAFDPGGFGERIRAAGATWFWPAMETKSPGLTISANEVMADASTDADIRPFVECWRQRRSRRATLEQPGHVVIRPITVELPAGQDGTKKTRATALLVVRLAEETSTSQYLGHVAMFRGPGMVVKYWNRAGAAHGMRPFHAILACGVARAPEAPTEEDQRFERFLRDAEPPGHDEWHSTSALKEGWKLGYKKALDLLKERVTQELRDLLVPKPSAGSRGPERLQKRFPIGKRGTRKVDDSPFNITGLAASFEGGRWTFAGTVQPTAATSGPWQASIGLRELGDRGARLEPVLIESLEVETAEVALAFDGEVVRIDAPAGTEAVPFSGTSVAMDAVRGAAEVVLDVSGSLVARGADAG